MSNLQRKSVFWVGMRHPLNQGGLTLIVGESITVRPGGNASGFGSVVVLWLYLAERDRDARYGNPVSSRDLSSRRILIVGLLTHREDDFALSVTAL